MMTGHVRVLELRSVRGTGGGPEKTILLGAQRADRAQFAVTVCYIRDMRDRVFGIGARARRLGIDYVEVVERSSVDLSIWPALRALVRHRAIDIVHAHEYKTNLLALWLARTEGVIPLATSHGWSGHSRRERFLYYPIDKQLLRAFPVTIAVSGQIRSELLRVGVRSDRVHVILNGVDHREFRRDRSRESSVRRDLDLSDDEVVIGAIGSLEACKRFDLLIRACAALRRRWRTLKLLVAGDGSLAEDLRALAARLLPGACHFLGHHQDVIALHHAFDVFVLSSDHEGTPNVLLEAMALETPVVTTAAGAEIIEDGVHGLVVPVGNENALSHAIEQTLVDREQTAVRVARARQRAESSLSFDARMAAVENVYRELISRYPRRTKRWTAA